MAANYTVNYKINVHSHDATEAIKAFSTATDGLSAASEKIRTAKDAITQLKTSLDQLGTTKTIVAIDVNTDAADKKIDALMTKIKTISTSMRELNGAAIGGKKKGFFSKVFGGGEEKIATEELRAAESKISALRSEIDKLNQKNLNPKANTKTAQGKLDTLLETLQKISEYRKITISANVSGGGISSGTGASTGGSSSESPSAPEVNIDSNDKKKNGSDGKGGGKSDENKNKSKSKPKAKSSAGHSTYLFPSTRQVLGPTYAGGGSSMMGEMVKGFGVAYGMSALTTGVANIFRDATVYDNIKKSIENILRTHDTDPFFDARFNQMNMEMRQLGVNTKFTAPEVASAGKFLAMAGFKVDDIRQAIKPITDIALVGDTDLGETADVVTNIMTSFDMLPSEVGKASDILTMTATKTNTTVMTLAESFKYAGTVAHQTGLSMEEVTAMFGILGNAGIQGSLAGTSVRMVLLNMLKRPKAQQKAWDEMGISPLDENGNMRNVLDIFRDLNQKSKEMSPTKFSELIGRMFRVTAAPGALAMIRGVDKIDEVMDENYRSGGLASRLAFEKQNTIEGLWYQITSAFTESGIREFEGMQTVIRDFMKEILAIMKSGEFAETIRSSLNLMLQGGQALKRFGQAVMSIFNAIPESFKGAIAFFVEVQMWCGILAVTAKSIGATFIFLRGVVAGDWLGKIVYIFASVVKGIGTLNLALHGFFKRLNLWIGMTKAQRLRFQLWTKKKGSKASSGNDDETIGDAVESDLFGELFKGKKGNALNNLKKLTPVSALGKLGGMLAGAGPAGIIGGIAATSALALSVGYKVFQNSKGIAEEATMAMDKWAESYRNLGVGKLDVTKNDDLIIGNMRIFNSTLTTHSERLSIAADMYNKLAREKKKFQDLQSDDTTPYLETKEAQEIYGGLLKWMNGKGSFHDANFSGVLEALGIKDNTIKIPSTGLLGLNSTTPVHEWVLPNGRKLTNTSDDDIPSKSVTRQIMFAMYGADPNHPKIKQLEYDLLHQLPSATSVKNFDQLMESYHKSFLKGLEVKPEYNTISESDFNALSAAEFDKAPVAVDALKQQMEAIFTVWKELIRPIYVDMENGRPIDKKTAQAALSHILGPAFLPEYGTVGSPEWASAWKGFQKNPETFNKQGITFETEQAVTAAIQTAMRSVIDMYNNTSEQFKPWLAYFIPSSQWEDSILHPGDNPLGIQTYQTSGYKEGQVVNIGGKKYTFRSTMLDQMQGALYDDKGNIYAPKRADNIFSTFGENSDIFGNKTGNGLTDTGGKTHNEDDYKSRYASASSAPKQVIVKIENLMNVNSIDLTKEDNRAAIESVKTQIAYALNEVAGDFAINLSENNI